MLVRRLVPSATVEAESASRMDAVLCEYYLMYITAYVGTDVPAGSVRQVGRGLLYDCIVRRPGREQKRIFGGELKYPAG